MPKPVRPFPLISYYWEPSIGFRWKGTRYGIRHYGSSGSKFLSGFQMKITNRERDTVAPDYYVKYSLTLSKGGKDFGLDGCLTYELNAYSGVPAAAHRASYPLVEFYDTSQDAARFPGGQFVSRYYMTDLLEDNSIAVSLDTMLKNGNPFSLDGGIPAWTVEGDDLAKVNDFLKKSCMEFSGSLPGDEKDEDGYSLTGEAKDATASRNGLSRNQTRLEEKVAECREAATALANGDAL